MGITIEKGIRIFEGKKFEFSLLAKQIRALQDAKKDLEGKPLSGLVGLSVVLLL